MGPVVAYLIGIGVFGFAYWLMDGVIGLIVDVGVHETGTVFDFLDYIFLGVLVVYLVFGGIWVVRKYNEREYQLGFR